MGLLQALGLSDRPGRIPKAPSPPAPMSGSDGDAMMQSTAIVFNASPAPLRLQVYGTSKEAQYWQKPPNTIPPNTRGTVNVRHDTDIELTSGDVTYASGDDQAQTEVVFSWKGRTGEIRAKGPGRYATATTYRQRGPKHREYLFVFKDTSGVKGPVLDALDKDMERVERDVDEDEGKPATGQQPGGAGKASEFSGICRITIVNDADATLALAAAHLDNDKANFGVEPPAAVPAGRTAVFVAWSRDPEHPEIGGFADYTFRIDPPPAANPSGEFTLKLAWSGTTSGSNVSPHVEGIDVKSGGKPRQFVFTLTGPPIAFVPPKATSQPTLRKGDKSPDGWVEYLQQLLNLKADVDLDVDGDFGKLTRDAVIAYQRKLKKKDPAVLDDGVVGDQTWSYLREGAPAKPATDGRKPHAYVDKGIDVRWLDEKSLVVYHMDRNMLTLSAYSVGDTDRIAGRTARVRITGPDKTQKVADALIGKGEKSSKTGQGFEHLVTIETVSDLFGGGALLPDGVYSIEAYFPADLGGDHCVSTLNFEAPKAG